MKLVYQEIVEIYIVEWLEKSKAATGLNEKVKDLADHKERENLVKTLR